MKRLPDIYRLILEAEAPPPEPEIAPYEKPRAPSEWRYSPRYELNPPWGDIDPVYNDTWGIWPNGQPYPPTPHNWPYWPNGMAWPRDKPDGWPEGLQYPPPRGHPFYQVVDNVWPPGNLIIHNPDDQNLDITGTHTINQNVLQFNRLPESVRYKLIRDLYDRIGIELFQMIPGDPHSQAGKDAIMWILLTGLFGLGGVVGLGLEAIVWSLSDLIEHEETIQPIEDFLRRPAPISGVESPNEVEEESEEEVSDEEESDTTRKPPRRPPSDTARKPPRPPGQYYWDAENNIWRLVPYEKVRYFVPNEFIDPRTGKLRDGYTLQWSTTNHRWVIIAGTPPNHRIVLIYIPYNPIPYGGYGEEGGNTNWYQQGEYWYYPAGPFNAPMPYVAPPQSEHDGNIPPTRIRPGIGGREY